MLRITREQYIGKTYEELAEIVGWKHGEGQSFKRDDMEVLMTQEAKFNVEEPPLEFPDGTLHYFLTSRVPMKNEIGELLGVAGISIDITERKIVEEELRLAKEKADIANQAKSNFLAMMSHEMRTPLNAILGMAQILNGKNDIPPEYKEYINIIQNSSESFLFLINNVLEFAKLESGKVEIKNEVFNPSILTEQIVFTLKNLADSKNLKLVLNYDERIPYEILGDQGLLRQILINLIGNAIKFTEAGSVEVDVQLESQDENIARLAFKIKDTGVGIPADKLENIFERFFQVDTNYNRRYEGAGLGLAITKQFVEGMGGKILVNSKLGFGSEFSFVLSFGIVEKSDMETQHKETNSSNILKLIPGCRILVVEDNKLNQHVAKLVFGEIGAEIEIVETGEEALELLTNNSFSMVFMDLSLPDMDGFAITEKFRQQEKIGHHTPIIALTAHVLEEDRLKCFAAGMDDVLVKPIMINQLKNLLQKWKMTQEMETIEEIAK